MKIEDHPLVPEVFSFSNEGILQFNIETGMCERFGENKGIVKVVESQENPVSFYSDSNKIYSDIFNFIFNQSADSILVSDLQGHFKKVNASSCTMLGYTQEELLRSNIKTLIDAERSSVEKIWLDLINGKVNDFTCVKMQHKQGCVIYVELKAKKIDDDKVVVFARDFTKLKNVDRILKKSEANLNTILETTDTIYVLLDTEFRIVSYNPRAVDFVKNELNQNIEVNNYFLDYFPDERQPLLFNYMKAVLAGKHINYEVSYPQHSGFFNWYYVRWFPISNCNNVYGLMMAVSDITEKKLLQEKLEEERVRKQMEITGAVITAQENERHAIGLELHDNVNQVLATAQLFVGLAQYSKGKKSQDYLGEVDKLLTEAINEIRNLSHSMVPPLVDGSGLLDSISYLLQTIKKGSDLIIKTEINIDEKIICNKLKLTIYRIFQEQINNILKHAKARVIVAKLVRDNDNILLSIKDDGVGFNTALKSNGIGLMNIRTRACLNNGQVEIISSPGKGCELVVKFVMR